MAGLSTALPEASLQENACSISGVCPLGVGTDTVIASWEKIIFPVKLQNPHTHRTYLLTTPCPGQYTLWDSL